MARKVSSPLLTRSPKASKLAMPKLDAEAKSTIWYHGCSDPEAVIKIMKDGIRPDQVSLNQGMPGYVYLSSALYEAGRYSGDSDPKSKSYPYGYVFEIDGRELAEEAEIEEDHLGDLISNFAVQPDRDARFGHELSEEIKSAISKLPSVFKQPLEEAMTLNDEDAAWNSVYTISPMELGQEFMSVLSSRAKQMLFDFDTPKLSIAYKGSVMPTRCIQFLRKSPMNLSKMVVWHRGGTIPSLPVTPKVAKTPYKTVEFDGWTILIGRSAADNDILSMEVAAPQDFWLHVAEVPGSHVVVRNPEGLAELPEDVLQEAGRLAVQNSKAKGQAGVKIVLGKASDLSKPKGSATGEILISNYKTVKIAALPYQAPPPPRFWDRPAITQTQNPADQWYYKMKGPELEAKYGLKPGILKHMIEKESKGNPVAVSPAGAKGLFQIMPANVSGFHGDPFDPRESGEFVAKTMSHFLSRFGTYEKALAAYNWGPTNLKRHGIRNAPPETRKYLRFFKSKGMA